MAKFNTTDTEPRATSPITSEATPSGTTFAGGAGHARDLKSELFLLAVANMVGENTFYESADRRDTRYAELVRKATLDDPEWTARFLAWLRNEANMRTASLVGAAEFAKARNDAGLHGQSRKVIDSVLQRADEPGELLAYWKSVHGRKMPHPVKRGVADAAIRLYNERSLLKHDSASRGVRFADVLALTHAGDHNAAGQRLQPWQGQLYNHILDARHGNNDGVPSTLAVLQARAALMAIPVEQRRAILDRPDASVVLAQAAMTWEALAGWLQGPMDAKAWEIMIPSMGYMALLRNLRNFDEANVSDDVAMAVAQRLGNPDEVARSRQFPFRFLSAYQAVHNLRWGPALEKALTMSLANVPALQGRTLVLIDRSPSMFPGYGCSTPNKSEIALADQAAVFGCAVAMRAADATVAVYGGTSRIVDVPRGGSLLRFVDQLGPSISYTDTAAAVRAHYRDHDRVLIVTDEQSASATSVDAVPSSVPVHVWNIGGYERGNTPSGAGNRHTYGGMTDQAFRLVSLVEAGQRASWPF